ncbi:MAG: tetratricopeptide repeat protein [Nitrospirae bacterium]|nr:tetratricopeptide repeat protein [Nitrospirota bacterium]
MKWKIILFIAVISVAVYSNSFRNSFHFDDQHYIVENPYIRDVRNIPSFFLSPEYSSFEKVFTSHYRPLLVSSYAINYAIGGLRPEGYHAVNLLFHIGSAFLVYLILGAMMSLNESPAFMAGPRDWGRVGIGLVPPASAVIFAVHPFNSEVVNYITARSSVMCTFFYLLSFYFWIRFRQSMMPAIRPAAVNWLPYYIISVIAFIFALLTKEIAVTLPLILVLYDFYFLKQPTRGSGQNSSSICPLSAIRCLAYLPYIFLIIIPYLAYRIYVYGSITGGGARNYAANILTQPYVLLKYLQLMFVPYGLTIEHDLRLSETIYDWKVILSFAAILIILVIAYLLFKRGGDRRLVSFFMLWFFITMLPTAIIPLNAILQENRGYLAGVMFAAVPGIVIGRFKKKLILPWVAVLVAVLFIITFQRNPVWRDDLALWSDAVAKSPVSARAHDNLGLAYLVAGKYDLALDEFNKTIGLNRQYYLAWYNAGVAYQLQGDLEKARLAYEESLKINPAYFRSYYNAGIVYKKLGELDMAISSYEKAIALDPRHPFVYNNLGVALTEKGDLKKAEDIFMRIIAISPRYEKAYYNLGNVYFREKEYGKAVAAYSAAVRIKPDYKEADQMLREAKARQ